MPATLGNNETVARECAENLISVDEATAGHEDYEAYYGDSSVRRLSNHLFSVDASSLHYRFGIEGPYNVPYAR